MIKYPLYQFPVNGVTPFDEYKTAAHGDAILDAVETQIEGCYNDYENAVNSSSVHNLSPHGFVDPEKEHLKKLYKSDCNIVKKIRQHHSTFTSTTKRVYNNKCPYCTLSEPDTIEHILPKDKYPEFAIHLYNLIPCCSKCNRHKSEAVSDQYGLPYTINFYYHDPEYCQFLEVDCIIDYKGSPSFKYKLTFPQGVDPTLTAIITNHFNRLHLIERYNEEVLMSYTVTESTIKSACGGKTLNDALQYLKNYLSIIKNDYGLNHHYVAMIRCMIDSPIYHAYLQSIL